MVTKSRLKRDVILEKEPKAVSAAALQLFEQMQDPGFAAGVAKFKSMSPKEMGEAARKAVAVRKASR